MNCQLDEIDKKIIDILRENARISYADIAVSVGISRVAVGKLEDAGVIVGYQAVIGETSSFPELEFFMDIQTEASEYENIQRILGKQKFISDIFLISGTTRIIFKGRCENKNFIERLVHELLTDIKGISKLEWNLISSVLKEKGEIKDVKREPVLRD